MNQHHQKALEQFVDQYGLALLKEIHFCLARGDNRRKMMEKYSVENYQLNYLATIAEDVTCYIHLSEERRTLRLVYPKSMAA